MADATTATSPADNNSYYPAAAMANLIQEADNQAKWAYYNKMMELQTVPMTQIAKDQAAAQAAAQAATTALQSANLNIQQMQGAQSAIQAASGLNLQQSLGNQNAIQAAAGLQSQEGMGAMNLVAQLRGPQNAFQQQAVMEGLNHAGLSNAVDAIAGRYSQGALGRQYAAPQGATLGSLASDMSAAGGYTGQMSPSEIAMQQALGLQGQNPAGLAVQGAINMQGQPMQSGLAAPDLAMQRGIANQTANWGMGGNYGVPTGVPISAQQINTMGSQWGVDPKYIQGYVNSNGSLPQSPGVLTQWNQVNGFQSPIDGTYTGHPPVSSVTGYNAASSATGSPVGYGSPLNYAMSGYNQQYTGGSIPSNGSSQAAQSAMQQGYQAGVGGQGDSSLSSNTAYLYGSPATSQPTYGSSQPYGYQSYQPYATPAGTMAPGGSTYNSYQAGLPALNNIDMRNYNRMTDDTKSFLGSDYTSAGYSQNDLNNAAQKGATPWTAPQYGSIG